MIKINRLLFSKCISGKRFNLLTLTKNNFCSKIEMEKKVIDLKIENEISLNKIYFTKLTKNIYKFLTSSCTLYNNLGEDSVKIAYDVSNEPSNNYLKEELLRINKQLNFLQREVSYHDEITRIINDITFNVDLIKEACNSGESDIISNCKGELKRLSEEIVTLENEIVEYLIPDDEVYKLIIKER